MIFLKVTNYVNEVNRLSLEKLGFSTKRDNAETIGQFGSGIKFAPIAAIRSGKRFVFTGNDSRGGYALEYIVKNDEGIDSIFYKYEDYEKPSSFTADAGVLSWENTFQIYREIIANAADEAKISGIDWTVEIVNDDEIKSVPGEFSVFITADDSIMEIHNNFDKYFCLNRKPVHTTSQVKFYEPIDDKFRIYCKGVLVYTHDRFSDYGTAPQSVHGIYDYEIDGITLNEERTIRNTYDINGYIARAFYDVQDKYVISHIINEMMKWANNDDNSTILFELGLVPQYAHEVYKLNDHDQSNWSVTFQNMYPDTVLVSDEDARTNVLTTVTGKGFNPLVIKDSSLYRFFETKKIPTVYDILGESFKYDYSMDISNSLELLHAINIIETVDPVDGYALKNKIGVFTPDSSSTLGMTVDINGDGERVILISRDHIKTAKIEELISTLIHEIDHLTTGYGDGDSEGRAFRNVADIRIGHLIYKMWLMKNFNN